MATARTAAHSHQTRAASGVLEALADETSALVRALLSPNTIIDEVKQARALQVEASRIEAADPVRAEAMRQRASRIGRR